MNEWITCVRCTCSNCRDSWRDEAARGNNKVRLSVYTCYSTLTSLHTHTHIHTHLLFFSVAIQPYPTHHTYYTTPTIINRYANIGVKRPRLRSAVLTVVVVGLSASIALSGINFLVGVSAMGAFVCPPVSLLCMRACVCVSVFSRNGVAVCILRSGAKFHTCGSL